MRHLTRYFAAFCVATVFAELAIIILLYFSGRLNHDSGSKIVALACGIDISAEHIRNALTTVEQQEVPSFEEVLQKRANESLELDLRRASINNSFDQLRYMEEQLQRQRDYFDERREAHNESLKMQQAGIQTEAMKELQQLFDGMSPAQAKSQLIRMMENQEMSEVVTILQGMPTDRTNKILKEFSDPADADKLYEIIRTIKAGEPLKSLIDQALQDSQAASRNAPAQ